MQNTEILATEGKTPPRETHKPGNTYEPENIYGIEVRELTMNEWVEFCAKGKMQTPIPSVKEG